MSTKRQAYKCLQTPVTVRGGGRRIRSPKSHSKFKVSLDSTSFFLYFQKLSQKVCPIALSFCHGDTWDHKTSLVAGPPTSSSSQSSYSLQQCFHQAPHCTTLLACVSYLSHGPDRPKPWAIEAHLCCPWGSDPAFCRSLNDKWTKDTEKR